MSRRNTLTFGALLLLALVVAGMVAMNVVSEPRPRWQNPSLTQRSLQGELLALEAFFNKQTASTPLRKWRLFDRALKQSGHDEGPVSLWLESSRLATEEDYRSLFSWVAEGHHVVLPLPDHYRQAQDDGPDDDKLGGISEAAHRRILRSYLQVDVDKAVAVKQPQATAAVRHACEQVAQGRQQAAQIVAQPLNDTGAANMLQRCLGHANLIRLPEGPELVWYDGEEADKVFKPAAGSRVLWQGQGVSGSRILRVQHGEGTVLLVGSIGAFSPPLLPPMDESNLNLFNHAYLSAYLATDKSAIWLVRELGSKSDKTPGPAWWRLWQAQPVLMFSLLLLLVCGVWHVAVRMGTRRVLSLAQERDLSGHLRAQGRFEAQKQAWGGQLVWMQQQLWHEWQQQWPQWRHMNDHERLNIICRHSGLPPSVVKIWLDPIPARPTRKDWLHYIRAHRRLLRTGRSAQRS